MHTVQLEFIEEEARGQAHIVDTVAADRQAAGIDEADADSEPPQKMTTFVEQLAGPVLSGSEQSLSGDFL